MKAADINVLNGLVHEFKIKALIAGRLGRPFTEGHYNKNRKGAFRCVAYNRLVRHINALERLLKDERVII
jgi:hypothetical protein